MKAAILDIDGTLLLSNDAHAQAFAEAAARLGIAADRGRIRRLIGKGSDKLIPEAFGFEAESPLGKELQQAKGRIFVTRYLPTLQPTPGARSLLSRLHREGITLIVATSADKDAALPLLERAGVRDLIDDTVSADDVDSSKPDPDVVDAAISKSGEKPREVIMVGDTPYDVEAAGRAGIPTLAVRCGGWSDHDLHGAVGIYDDPADILAHYERAFDSVLNLNTPNT